MKQFDFKEVQKVNEKVQVIEPEVLSNAPMLCYQTMIWAATQRAYIGEQQAIAKKNWMDVKKKAYETFVLSNEANQTKVEKYGVMAVKDYIASSCGDWEARHEYCVRTNAALDSIVSALTMVISGLKEEMKQQRA
jgi:hypothetical protein